MKLVKRLVEGEELQLKIREGVSKAFTISKAGYGPKSGNALLEQIYGDPILSHDGITNIRNYFDADPVINMTIRALVQASNKNNKTVGDGTTGAVILSYYLYVEAYRLVLAGYNRMEVAELIKQTADSVIDQLIKSAKPFKKSMVKKIANVSSGSEAISEMLDDIFTVLGTNGHVLIQDTEGDFITSEIIEGFYFPKGLTYLALANDPSNLVHKQFKPPIIISEKRFMTATDIAPILSTLVKSSIKDVILIGELHQEALDFVARNKREGFINVVAVEPMHHEGIRSLFLDDLATVIGGKVLSAGFRPSDFTIEMLGYAESVTINTKSTTIIGGDGAKEDVEKRISDLDEQLKEATNQIDIDNLSERLARLRGKLAIVTVGAPGDLERKEVKLRVEDAISAVQASPLHGVLPGGGVALARVNAGQFSGAYQSLLKCLAENSGLNTEKILISILESKYWYGFNFRSMSSLKPDYTPVELYQEGIIDPAEVVIEIVKNATSAVSSLITVGIAEVLNDRDEKEI
jgi:chaperonin GroEL